MAQRSLFLHKYFTKAAQEKRLKAREPAALGGFYIQRQRAGAERQESPPFEQLMSPAFLGAPSAPQPSDQAADRSPGVRPGPPVCWEVTKPLLPPFLNWKAKQSKAVGISRESTVANERTPLFRADTEAVGRHGSFKVFSNLC